MSSWCLDGYKVQWRNSNETHDNVSRFELLLLERQHGCQISPLDCGKKHPQPQATDLSIAPVVMQLPHYCIRTEAPSKVWPRIHVCLQRVQYGICYTTKRQTLSSKQNEKHSLFLSASADWTLQLLRKHWKNTQLGAIKQGHCALPASGECPSPQQHLEQQTGHYCSNLPLFCAGIPSYICNSKQHAGWTTAQFSVWLLQLPKQIV